MPASFTDQHGREEPVQGRRDDELDLVEAITAATALAAVAELATGVADAPVREDAVVLTEDDVLATEDEAPASVEPDADDDEDD